VKSLFRSRTANRKATLEDLIGGYELSPFPGAILKAMEVIREEASSLEEIAEALRGDPALSVRVLQLVNSASFGLRRAVDDLAQAVHMIGRSSLESLLISIGVRRALPGGRCSGYDPRRFWQTAARRAATARALAQELEPARRSRAFTAAFLQDIAVTLLVDRMPEEYGAVLTRWHAEGVPLHELEREITRLPKTRTRRRSRSCSPPSCGRARRIRERRRCSSSRPATTTCGPSPSSRSSTRASRQRRKSPPPWRRASPPEWPLSGDPRGGFDGIRFLRPRTGPVELQRAAVH
jgi:hypothetical protein